LQKNWHFLIKTKLNSAKIGSYHWFLRKRLFFAENWQKSQKIVIIISTLVTLKNIFINLAGAFFQLPHSSQSQFKIWKQDSESRKRRQLAVLPFHGHKVEKQKKQKRER
jgi:hypothetical protein